MYALGRGYETCSLGNQEACKAGVKGRYENIQKGVMANVRRDEHLELLCALEGYHRRNQLLRTDEINSFSSFYTDAPRAAGFLLYGNLIPFKRIHNSSLTWSTRFKNRKGRWVHHQTNQRNNIPTGRYCLADSLNAPLSARSCAARLHRSRAQKSRTQTRRA